MLEGSKNFYSDPCFSKNLSEYGQILLVKFSPFKCSQDILLVAFKERIVVGRLCIKDNSIDIDLFTEIAHPYRCTSLSFSPETLLNVTPNILSFCAAGSDFILRLFTSDLMNNNVCKLLSGHKSYINDTSFDSENMYLASTSDDRTVKIWMADSLRLKCTFVLTSPGINVCWHRADPGKLLVAEKMGLISFYNVENETCIFSTDYGKSLSSCHWSPTDDDIIASIHQGELLVWQLPNKCMPLHKCMIFPENGGLVNFSSQGEFIASVNCLDNSLKVLHLKSQTVKLSATVTLPTNVSWHYRHPLFCIGDDDNLCFWKVFSNWNTV